MIDAYHSSNAAMWGGDDGRGFFEQVLSRLKSIIGIQPRHGSSNESALFAKAKAEALLAQQTRKSNV